MSTSLQKILVPVDGSEGAIRAVHFAARLAADTAAEVVLLHVYDASALGLMGLKALTRKEIDAAMNAVARDCFQKAKAVVEVDVPIVEVVRMGHPSSEIVEYAKAERPDMIVMGSRGQSEFRSLILGSVSTQVVHHAPCPVTIVR